MLFKDYHIPQIRSGSKTVTRREWDENYNRPNVGSVQIASDEMFTSDEEADCYIRITDVYKQALHRMTDEDARKEGDYGDLEEFREGYEDVYGEGSWDPGKVVTVVEFEYVGRERPNRQTKLAPDGGRRLPAWAERTESGRIRCTRCGNEADELPVEHDCIYANDLVADGGTDQTETDREEPTLREQVRNALEFLEYNHGMALRMDDADAAHAYYQAIDMVEAALDDELRKPEDVHISEMAEQEIARSRDARDGGFAAATLLGQRFPGSTEELPTTLVKIRQWLWRQFT